MSQMVQSYHVLFVLVDGEMLIFNETNVMGKWTQAIFLHVIKTNLFNFDKKSTQSQSVKGLAIRQSSKYGGSWVLRENACISLW